MSRYAHCDNCGAKDDCCFEANHPILQGGLLLQFRDDDSGFEGELELCEECRAQLLKLFPKLENALKSRQG